jgi:hypothetical protein
MLKPSHLNKSHLSEWLSSTVDPDIIYLNVESLEGDTALERLTENAIERIGEGQKVPHSHQYATGPVKKILDRYRDMSDEGWWCSGIDVSTGKPSLWGCFKPDTPRRAPDGKIVKYEHPAGVSTEIFALRIPDRIWQEIADRHGVNPSCPLPLPVTVVDEKLQSSPLHTLAINRSISHDTGDQFWRWAIDENLPLIIAEGAKKAGALLTAGYLAIALPGIFNGYRQEKDESGNRIGMPSLIAHLIPFATAGRDISFCFDRDTKPKTIENVRKAIGKTGGLLKRRGCKVSVIQWDEPYKGVDDLIATLGSERFDRACENRITLEAFKLEDFTALKPDLTINERYIPDSLTFPDKARLIGLKSPKGTGKTEFLARTIAPLLAHGEKVIIIVHREQLAIALASRFGGRYRTEVSKLEGSKLAGYCLCIDSLHDKASPPFDPSKWNGATVIMDEVEQVLWHVLEGDTCRENRVRILKAFLELLQTVASTGGKIYISDADLTRISIDYIKDLIGFPVSTYIVENIYREPVKRPLYSFEGLDPSELVTALETAVSNGEKPFILTDGQKHKSKWGTRNLEHHFKKKFPWLKILRVDRESVADPNHPAYGCVDGLNTIVARYDVLIASPVIETGVSIDIRGHFTSVWGISHGVQPYESVCQGLARVRENVPRYLWAKEYSPTRIGNGSIELKSLLASTHGTAKANIALLQKVGLNEFSDLDFLESEMVSQPSLMAWAKRACILNHQNKEFGKNLLDKLVSEGYELTEFEGNGESDPKTTKEAIEESRNELYHSHCQAVSDADALTDTEFEFLNEKRERTEDELNRLKKRKLTRRYHTENITADLIAKDDDGWYPKIRLQYYLTVGNSHLKERDRKSLSELTANGDGIVFKPDVNKSQLSAKIETLKLIGIEMFFDPQQEFTGDNLRDWFDRLNNPLTASHIRAILGVSLAPNDSPIAFVQRLLKSLFGLKLTFDRQQMIDGVRKRYYRGCNPNSDGRGEIFALWLDRDEKDRGISLPLENVSA